MKTHTVKVVAEIYYKIEGLPEYCTDEAAAKMVELAFENNGTPKTAGEIDGILQLSPVEICVDKVVAA